jgi:TolB protein
MKSHGAINKLFHLVVLLFLWVAMANAQANDEYSPQFAFISDHDGNPNIYLYDVATRTESELSDDVAANVIPAWSGDGEVLAHVENSNNAAFVHFVNAVSDRNYRHPESFDSIRNLVWRPNNYDLLVLGAKDGHDGIYRVTYGGRTVLPLVYLLHGQIFANAITPDGERLIYSDNGMSHIYNFNDFESTYMDSHSEEYPFLLIYEPVWSADGSAIYFTSLAPYFDMSMNASGEALFRMSPEGNDVEILFDGSFSETEIVPSPDGQYITMLAQGFGNSAVWLINGDGQDLGQVPYPEGCADTRTDGTVRAQSPVWSPDSRYIAFASNCDGDQDIFLYDIASDETILVTDNSAEDYAPAWRQNGTIELTAVG